MKLVVGLGNPGIEYQFTPHNIGFLVLDRIAEQCAVKISNRRWRSLTAKTSMAAEDVLLAKPETFMNLSGMAVRELVSANGIDPAKDLIVIYDELDLPLGLIRIRERGSSAGHNGMQSILNALGTQEVVRMRLGIAPEQRVKDGARYVLGQFKKAQYRQLDESLDRAVEALGVILKEGVPAAMSRFNRRLKPDEVVN